MLEMVAECLIEPLVALMMVAMGGCRLVMFEEEIWEGEKRRGSEIRMGPNAEMVF